jgi:hypothetical protein
MSVRDFSVMPVQFDTEDVAVERRVKNRSGSLRVGVLCDVEVGASWNHQCIPPRRRAGRYVLCQVTRTEGALVHVRLSPDPTTTSKTG